MDIIKLVIRVCIFAIILFGVILIYDARIIASKKTNIDQINKKTRILKIIGFVLSIIGAIVLLYIK